MNSPTTTKAAPRRARTDCCKEDECDSGLKNHYYPGKRITPEMFRVEQDYHLQRRRLINRAIHGWGVVYGYPVRIVSPGDSTQQQAAQRPSEPVTRKLVIDEGFALDECGRELLHGGTTTVEFDPDKVTWKSGPHPNACLKLEVHYAERPTGRTTVPDSCFCDHDEWDRKCETVHFTLTEIDCDDCTPDPCGRNYEWDTIRCDVLCREVIQFRPAKCKDGLFEIKDSCGDVLRVDLEHGVPLACVRVIDGGRGGLTLDDWIDQCAVRPLVKRNDLLFDLIPGCDLTRIHQIGWADWHRNANGLVPYKDFVYGLGYDGTEKDRFPSSRFWVEFTRPVRAETLRADCFAMTVLIEESEGGWWEEFRVPILDVEYIPIPKDPRNPPPLVRGARIVVDGAWLHDALVSKKRRFKDFEAMVEFSTYGDLVIDCNGKAVDLNSVGLWADRSGNGSPGGTFYSPFTLAKSTDWVRGESTAQTTGAST